MPRCPAGAEKHAEELTRGAASLLLYSGVLKGKPAQVEGGPGWPRGPAGGGGASVTAREALPLLWLGPCPSLPIHIQPYPCPCSFGHHGAQAFLGVLQLLQKGNPLLLAQQYGELYRLLAADEYASWQDYLLDQVGLCVWGGGGLLVRWGGLAYNMEQGVCTRWCS